MAKRNSEDRHHDEAIERGQKNADLMPSVKNWCEHLEVEMTSSGLLAQMTGLPIGTLRVVCPHGLPLIESSVLEQVARNFILRNCGGCPHHKETATSNFGRKVFAEQMAVDRQREEAKVSLEKEKMLLANEEKRRLDESDPSHRAVRLLVLEFQTAAVDSQEWRTAREKLLQAADIASEYFTDDILDSLLSHSPNTANTAPYTLPIARKVCERRGAFPQVVIERSKHYLTETYDMGGEAACGILLDYAEQNGVEDVAPLLLAVFNVINFRLAFFMNAPFVQTHAPFPDALALARLIFQQQPEQTRSEFDKILRTDDKYLRVNATKTLNLFLPDLVDHILPLAETLLLSFELEDDIYEESADEEVCELLAHLYAHAPERCEAHISTTRRYASDEIQVLLCRIYSHIIDASSGRVGITPKFPTRAYDECIPAAIDHILTSLGDLRLSLETRVEICEQLQHVVWEDAPTSLRTVMIERFERLTARLAMSMLESAKAAADNESRTDLTWMEKETVRLSFDRLLSQLNKIIRVIISYDPPLTFRHILDSIAETDTNNQEDFKAYLVGVLDIFAQDETLVPSVLPQLYKHLTDFESVLVRGRAIKVLGKLLETVPQCVPSNMIEWLVISLRDPFVMIHRNAVRSLQKTQLQRDDIGWDALRSIIRIEEATFEDNDTSMRKTEFLKEIERTLDYTFAGWPEVDEFRAHKLIPKYARYDDPYFSEDMLEKLARRARQDARAMPEFAEIAVNYLLSTWERDHQSDDYSDRAIIWKTLFDVTPSILHKYAERMQDLARSKSDRSPLESLRAIELLSHIGSHEMAIDVAEELLATIPDVKANAFRRQNYSLIVELERAEIFCSEGKTSSAIDSLVAAESVIPNIEKKPHEELEGMWRDGLIGS